MDIENALKIGKRFLKELDGFLAANYPILKCRDIHQIYFTFWNDLKCFKGNSNGFTGLSEYLIFRFLYHQLGDSFKAEEFTHDTKEFVRNDLRLRQSIAVRVNENRYFPDITIYKGDKDNLIAVIQIKVYLTHTMKEVQKEMETFRSLRKIASRNFRALLIIYQTPGRGKVMQELNKQKDENAWFDFLILGKNDELLAQKLRTSLLLDRLV
jgi:hypothetical protein